MHTVPDRPIIQTVMCFTNVKTLSLIIMIFYLHWYTQVVEVWKYSWTEMCLKLISVKLNHIVSSKYATQSKNNTTTGKNIRYKWHLGWITYTFFKFFRSEEHCLKKFIYWDVFDWLLYKKIIQFEQWSYYIQQYSTYITHKLHNIMASVDLPTLKKLSGDFYYSKKKTDTI